MKKERKCFLGFFFAIILLLATPLTASADSNDAPKKEYTREDIVSIAAKYGFTTQFIYCKTTQDVPLVNVNSLSSILEDMNATTTQTPKGTSKLVSIPLNAGPDYYNKKFSHIFTKKFGILPLYNFQSYSDITYMYFQGLPRFVDATNISISEYGISFMEWVSLHTKHEEYFYVPKEAMLQLVSYGHFVITLDIEMSTKTGTIVLPVRFTGSNGNLIDTISIDEIF